MSDRALVQNAADAKDVRRASRVEQRRDRLFRSTLRTVLSTEAGRAVCWELLSRAGVFRSIWDNSARIHYNAGRQDFGHELMAELIETDGDLYLLMEQEARNRLRRENRETDAAHTSAAAEGQS